MPEEPAAEAVADHQGPRSERRGKPPAENSDPPVNEWRKDRWSATLESVVPEYQSQWRMTKG